MNKEVELPRIPQIGTNEPYYKYGERCFREGSTWAQARIDSEHTFPSWMGEHPRMNSPWTTREDAILSRAFERGDTLSMVCKRHGRNAGGINERLMKLYGYGYFEREAWNRGGLNIGAMLAGKSASETLNALTEAANKVCKSIEEFGRVYKGITGNDK